MYVRVDEGALRRKDIPGLEEKYVSVWTSQVELFVG